MAITPDSLTDEELDVELAVEIEEQEEPIGPSRTWRIDFAKGRIGGLIDNEVEAIRQFAAKAIRTARSRYLIYSDDYGCELDELIGDDVTEAYLDAEIPRMVREALIYDDRIVDVTDINYRRDGSSLYIDFVIDTIFGEIETEVDT